MTLTNEQIEQILDGAPESWGAKSYNIHMGYDHATTHNISDLREILTLRQRVEDLEAQVPQWISVDERLPEKGGWYMVTIYDPFDLGYIADYGLMAHFSGGKSETWSECDPVDDGCVVTHWMPLIKAPCANQLREQGNAQEK